MLSVNIVDGPLGPMPGAPAQGAGAFIVFDGVVRPTEESQPIAAIDFEVYQPMAERTLTSLAQGILDKHRLCAVGVWHSRGRVPASQVAFRLQISSRHRKEGLAAMDEFIDRMKQDVPIWKHVVTCDSEGPES